MIKTKTKSPVKNASSQQKMKASNVALLFGLIRKHMPISRAQLAAMTGLSPTTVSMLVDEIIQNKWVCEVGPDNATLRGRKPIMLHVNASGGYIVTVEILSHGFICCLYDICLHKHEHIRVRDESVTSMRVTEEIRSMLKSRRIPLYRLLGIHVLFPGLFSHDTGTFVSSAVLPFEDIGDKNLVASLKEHFPKANVRVSNLTSAIAYREFLSDDYVPETRLLSVNIDEGISAAVILGDVRKECNSLFELEIGHIIVERNGPLCKCSNRGCLETMCSTVALFRKLNEKTALSLSYSDFFGAEQNAHAMAKVTEAFLAKDPAVMEVMQEFCFTLCCGLVSVTNLFDIQSIHISGSVLTLGNGFIDLVRTTLQNNFRLSSSLGHIDIDGSVSDYESMRCAAVTMSMDQIFQKAEPA